MGKAFAEAAQRHVAHVVARQAQFLQLRRAQAVQIAELVEVQVQLH
jgi:hypothetical protein